jgi:hypothetical protein
MTDKITELFEVWWLGVRQLFSSSEREAVEFGFKAGYAACEAQHQWQDIATAPRDGSKIQVLDKNNKLHIVYWGEFYVGCWLTGKVLPTMNAEPETIEPTHWKPLGDLPKGDK